MENYDEATAPYHPKVSGLEMLKGIVAEQGMSAAALARILGGDRSLGTKVLAGERRITADHARVLGALQARSRRVSVTFSEHRSFTS